MGKVSAFLLFGALNMATGGSKVSPICGFLGRCRASLNRGPPFNARNVVIGNQACDADSIISALCLAYMDDSTAPLIDNCAHSIPLAQIPRCDLIFRNEVKLLLDQVQTPLESLICVEDTGSLLHSGEDFELTLVDHNALDQRFVGLSEKVTQILDHHVDSNSHPKVTGEKRNIAFSPTTNKALVGSTCTLVAERYSEELHKHPDIATLLLGVIALDTINMDSSAGIGTERDAAALRLLGSISPHSQDYLFHLLRDAKVDRDFWRRLTVAEVLRIDYKNFQSPKMKDRGIKLIGIATAMQPMSEFLSKDNLHSTLEATIQAQDLSLLAVMSFVHQPSPTRELMICTPDRRLHDALVAFLLDNSKHDLKCELVQQPLVDTDQQQHTARELHLTVLAQRNAKASRKQVAPLLLEFFDSYG